MSEIGTAYVLIEPTAQGISGKIEKEMGGVGATSGASFSKGFSGALKGAGVAVAATGAAVGAMGAKLVSSASAAAEYGDNIDKMSQKLGLSAESYQKWDYVLGQSGTDIDSMQTGLKTMTNKLDDAKNGSEDAQAMFAKLGLSLNDIQNMSREDVFGAVIAGFQGMEDSTERAALANDMFGKSGQNLTPLFNESVESTQALMQAAEDLNMIISDDAVKGAAAYQDSLDTMKRTMAGVTRDLTSQFMPGITQVMDGLTQIFAGNSEGGIQQISEGVQSVVDGIIEHLPEIAKTGTEIVKALATAIIENLPELVSVGVDIVSELCKFIIDNLPEIIQVGLQIITELAMGIAEALPELIPTIVDTILTIVDYLIDNVDLLIDASIAIILGLAEGLIKALPKLIEKLPEIIIKIVEALIRNAPKILKAGVELIVMLIKGIVSCWKKIFEIGKQIIDKVKEGISQKIEDAKNWGKDLIKNFVSGITQKWEDLKNGVKGVAQSIKNWLGFSEPKEGPLSNFHTFAPDMMELYAKGITDNAGVVKDALQSATSGMMDTSLNANVAQSVNAQVGNIGVGSGSDLYRLLAEYLPIIAEGEGAQVSLVGDANALFNVMKQKNYEYKKQYGVSAFA